MNASGILQRGVQRNLKILGVKPFNPQERLASLTPDDRPVMERALREWYARASVDPLQSEALIMDHLRQIYGGR